MPISESELREAAIRHIRYLHEVGEGVTIDALNSLGETLGLEDGRMYQVQEWLFRERILSVHQGYAALTDGLTDHGLKIAEELAPTRLWHHVQERVAQSLLEADELPPLTDAQSPCALAVARALTITDGPEHRWEGQVLRWLFDSEIVSGVTPITRADGTAVNGIIDSLTSSGREELKALLQPKQDLPPHIEGPPQRPTDSPPKLEKAYWIAGIVGAIVALAALTFSIVVFLRDGRDSNSDDSTSEAQAESGNDDLESTSSPPQGQLDPSDSGSVPRSTTTTDNETTRITPEVASEQPAAPHVTFASTPGWDQCSETPLLPADDPQRAEVDSDGCPSLLIDFVATFAPIELTYQLSGGQAVVMDTKPNAANLEIAVLDPQGNAIIEDTTGFPGSYPWTAELDGLYVVRFTPQNHIKSDTRVQVRLFDT